MGRETDDILTTVTMIPFNSKVTCALGLLVKRVLFCCLGGTSCLDREFQPAELNTSKRVGIIHVNSKKDYEVDKRQLLQ